jgi:glutaconate CoA-transferase subunit B
VERRGGPKALVTGRALFSWRKEQRRFRLESVHPGHTAAEVREHTGFDYDEDPAVPETPGPAEQDLALLRGPVARQIAENYPDFARRVWGIQETTG